MHQNAVNKISLSEKTKDFFPHITTCIYYFMASLGFCYLYFHRLFYNLTFHEKGISGIYYILSFEAIKPNQYRLLVPLIFKALKTIFYFVPDKGIYFFITVVITFFVLIIFYNILNVYFENRKINQWLTFIIFYPIIWQYMILNQMFDFTDFANLFFIITGYYCIIKNYYKTLLLLFIIGCFSHDSIGFLIVMFVLFNIKDIFKTRIILQTAAMALIFIAVKKLMETIFIANPGLSFRPNFEYNIAQFYDEPIHRVLRNIFLFFGGMHIFVIYFFISGTWKKFNTKYLYIALTIVVHVIIVFLIHTTFEARNYITAIPYMIILFLLFFTTQKNSFLKAANEIIKE